MKFDFMQIIFYVFAAVAIFSSLMVVSAKNPVRGVLFLVVTFFASAGIWMLLHAEFLSLILVLVYVGAVMTLFLFVVMMLSVHLTAAREGFVRYLPAGALVIVLITGLTIVTVGPKHFGLSVEPLPPAKVADYSNTADLGSVLYTDYAYPFEIAAALLLTAIVASISLTHRKPHNKKTQNIARQIAVKPADRLRLVKMKAEPKK